MGYGSSGGRWSTRTKQQATVALRKVVAFAGVRADKNALHSLGIGGATHMSAGGASPQTLQREGRWASDAYKAYVRSHGEDASRVANYMAQDGMGDGIQPGQGADWEQVNPIPKLEG